MAKRENDWLSFEISLVADAAKNWPEWRKREARERFVRETEAAQEEPSKAVPTRPDSRPARASMESPTAIGTGHEAPSQAIASRHG